MDVLGSCLVCIVDQFVQCSTSVTVANFSYAANKGVGNSDAVSEVLLAEFFDVSLLAVYRIQFDGHSTPHFRQRFAAMGEALYFHSRASGSCFSLYSFPTA